MCLGSPLGIRIAPEGVGHTISCKIRPRRRPGYISPPHNVTLNIDGCEVVFIGEQLDERIEQHIPNLLDNDTVVQAMERHADILLFIDKTPQDRYALLVGMNNSHYVEILLT